MFSIIRPVPLVDQELLALPEHLSSHSVFCPCVLFILVLYCLPFDFRFLISPLASSRVSWIHQNVQKKINLLDHYQLSIPQFDTDMLVLIYNRQRKPKRQSRMDNPESQETLGKIHTTKTNNAKDTTQRTKKPVVNPGRIREG